MRIITFGTYDLFHIGHLNILKRCKYYKGHENTVIVGVSSDELNYKKKGYYPIICEREREEIIGSVRYVDTVFQERSLEEKAYYCEFYNADVLIMGDDHTGRFDFIKDMLGIEVVYVPRTEHISTSDILSKIKL